MYLILKVLINGYLDPKRKRCGTTITSFHTLMKKHILQLTLDFRIRVGPTLIYFGKFSHAYALIRVPTFNSFWEMSDGTLWHRSHPEQNATSRRTLNSFSLKLNKSSKELCHKTKILLYFSKNSHAYGNYDATLIHFLKNSHAYGN